jgi:outer membrane protein OmpA-like peptidoglycan-associated protein
VRTGLAPSAVTLALALGAAGCGATGIANSLVVDMDRMRTAPDVQEAARYAPQELALAESERAASKKAAADGDMTAAGLYAGQAVASYTDAVVLARLARATLLADQAKADLARDEGRAQKLGAERGEAEREANELDTRLQVAREALTPATSGHADPDREAARIVAARALAAQARLLCGAARLLSPSLAGLDAASQVVTSLEAQLDKLSHGAAPIDAAARARATCLALLTGARRSSDASALGEPDVLLSELSSSGQFSPSRDERGVVVVLRDGFKGTALAPAAAKQLGELGRVAVAHPAFAVQVVVHDATTPAAAEATADLQRAEAAAAAIVSAGAPAAKVKAETVGARAPLVDPQDARHRGRNARLEVVFVSPGG